MTLEAPLRVLMIGHSSWGGSGRVAARLSDALARRGHEVLLVTHSPVPWVLGSDVKTAVLRPEAVPAIDLHTHWSAEETLAFRDLIRRCMSAHCPEVIHAHYALPFARIVADACQIHDLQSAKVMTLHGTDVARLDRAELHALGRFAKCTTVSSAMVERAAAAGVSCALIPNFIDDVWINRPRPPKSKTPTIVHISNHRQVKDPKLLVSVLKGILEQSDLNVRIVGDGPELPRLKNSLEAAEKAHRLTFTDNVADPFWQIASSDLMLLTSRDESFSLVALEALACGVPVAAPAVGGLTELIKDGVEGLLYDRQAPAIAVRRIIDHLYDRAAMERLSTAATHRARAFSEIDIVSQYEALYHRAMIQRQSVLA